MNPLVLLIVKACLIADPLSCISTSYFMQDGVTEEQCRHFAPVLLPQVAEQHPDFKIEAFACVVIHKDRGA